MLTANDNIDGTKSRSSIVLLFPSGLSMEKICVLLLKQTTGT